MSTRKMKFCQRLTEARDRLLVSIDGLDTTTLNTSPVVRDWTIKDIFGHVISWNQEFRADILSILQGKDPGYDHQISDKDDFDEWNQEMCEKKDALTWEEVKAEFERDTQEALDLIDLLEPHDFHRRGVTPWKKAAFEKPFVLQRTDTESIETLITYHWRHMNQHARMIEAWRGVRVKKASKEGYNQDTAPGTLRRTNR